MKISRHRWLFFATLLSSSLCFASSIQEPGSIAEFTRRIQEAAAQLLASEDVSYIFGGHAVGSPRACTECTQCLSEQKPIPKKRLQACPICRQCGIDCSHFTQRVYEDAGIAYPYLETAAMLTLPPAVLKRRYGLVALPPDISRAIVGDLLVYEGHVVLLEGAVKAGRGDIMHATSGREIRGPGMGIQRHRQASLQSYRGPLKRILRHSTFYRIASKAAATRGLRPIAPRP